MARKKKAEMTPVELVDQALKGRTWDEAETAGIEILARCLALHAYARNDGEAYFRDIMHRICIRADEWAHEPGHPFIIACAYAGNNQKQERKNSSINNQNK